LNPITQVREDVPGLGELEWTDLFCGAGGSSLGLEHVPGMRVVQALNHWDLAVQAHNANFPDADHDLHDVQEIPASRFRRTDCLWASPECTHHAYCRGPKADDEEGRRSRMTMADVVRFADFHRYDAVIVENVIETRLWCDEHGSKCNCGASFNAWFAEIEKLGYTGRILYFNSQFALPTPQSRDRMYVVFWRDGVRAPNLDFQPPSWCSTCEQVVHGIQTWKKASKGSVRDKVVFEWGRYGSQYTYTCPACADHVAPAVMGSKTIIDWDLPIERIGDRDKDLAPKTRTRIKNGLERLATTEPITVQVGGHLYERPGYARVWSVDDPMRTVTGTPYMAVVARAGGQSAAPSSAEQPMGTITAHDRQIGLMVPGGQHMLVQVNRGSKGRDDSAHRTQGLDVPHPAVNGHGEMALVSLRNHGGTEPGNVPAQTVVGGGNHHGMLVYNGVPGHCRDPEFEPAGTVTGRDKQSLLVPYYGTAKFADPTDKPMGTITGKDRRALVITDDHIDDCGFRMLQWPELLKAQQMHQHSDGREYQLTARTKDKRGNYRELSNEKRVKMIGNAVSSPVAAMLGHAVAEALR
jgi:DNA (cytosine-5)-methyltransferase 1